ncbi:putative transcription factor ssDNA-binding-TF family [Lupinus albus]|uniref:Putative transcription factor ssDNA-binding-TF family n=1 Tax=Lupinus albus TaxID=3870 RepID=A0A6A4QPR8_LUPAL|nr:putative transcription factor ssDNA-binding-TF family [Lupinus albus]
MLQPHSCSAPTQSSITIPNHTFTPKFIPLKRSSSISTFSFTLQPLSIRCRHPQFYEPKPYPSSPQAQRSTPPPASVGDFPPRVYVGHSIYKGKAALTVNPRPPEFQSTESGAFKISREGYVLLQFAPEAGMRRYDWNKKQVFSLSMTEMGALISLGAKESVEFYHDPFQGKSDEGKVRKVLRVEPHIDGSGHLFNLSVQNTLENIDEKIFIPITKAELTVLSSLFTFIMPYLLGWHIFGNSIKPYTSGRANNSNPKYGADSEWNR